MDVYRRQFSVGSAPPQQTLGLASRMLGSGVRRDLLPNPIEVQEARSRETNGLLVSMERMRKRGLLTSPTPSLSGVPSEVQQAACLILEVALDDIALRNATFSRAPRLSEDYQREIRGVNPGEPFSFQRSLEFMRTVDMNYMYAASQDMSAALERARALLGSVSPTEAYRWKVSTGWGDIILHGGQSQTYADSPALLIIDTSSKNTFYNLPANKNLINWLSVVICTGGHNRYLSDPGEAETPVSQDPNRAQGRNRFGPGSAGFGLSFLLDTKGAGIFRSNRMSFGSALFGVAMVINHGEGNTYDAYADAQGFAKFGIGILENKAGNNHYEGFHQVQGCGLTQGLGMLIDRKGGSTFVANDSVLDFPAAQTADHNLSYAQGAGCGQRLDSVNGRSLSGGIGILLSQQGDNQYSCGVLGQGVGYWEGIGILWGGAGNDSYAGQYLTQGAASQYAIGLLDDIGGNDKYNAGIALAQGAGQDFAAGFLIDESGDDVYDAPNLSLGSATASGIGVFADLSGNDTYHATGIALGQAAESPKGTFRDRVLSLGLFIDLQGQDSYPPAFGYARNGSKVVNWRDKQESPFESQLGIFMDRG